MAKKKSFLGTLLKLGGLVAAGYAVYANREEIIDATAKAAEETEEDAPEA